jgi:hypothetical protein
MTVRTRGSAGETLDLLLRSPQEDLGSARWWDSVAHHLGELSEGLARNDIVGLAAQITTDAPQFAAAARRLSAIHDRAQLDLARSRREVAGLSGSTTAARDVRDGIEALLRQVGTLDRLSSDLMLDTYERDIGGE